MTRTSLLLLASIQILASTAAEGATCLNRSEARKIYRNAHLYWSIGPNGRCWGNSLMAARAMAKGVEIRKRPAAIAPEPLEALKMPPDAVADIMPPLQLSPIEWRWPRWE